MTLLLLNLLPSLSKLSVRTERRIGGLLVSLLLSSLALVVAVRERNSPSAAAPSFVVRLQDYTTTSNNNADDCHRQEGEQQHWSELESLLDDPKAPLWMTADRFWSSTSARIDNTVVGAPATAQPWLALALKPVALEVGALLVINAVGLPLASKALMMLARRLRFVQGAARSLALPRMLLFFLRKLQPLRYIMIRAQGRMFSSSRLYANVWKRLMSVYSKTSASKVVTRSKKLLKLCLFGRHEQDHEITESSSIEDMIQF